MLFVRIIQTIVVPVAHPSFWYASHVVAREVPRVRASSHRWFGVRVGHARFAVRVDLLAVRTPTLDFERVKGVVGRYAETQFLATTVVGFGTRVRIVDELFVFAVYLHAVQPVVLRFPNFDVGHHTGGLVYFDYGVQSPIGNVHPIY